MRDLSKIEEAIKILRNYKSDIVKMNKLSNKLQSIDYRDITQKRLGNMNADLNWACMNLDKSHKRLYKYIVENFETDLGPREYNPSGFHSYKG